MYLIDTHTLELEEFIGDSVPQYAILSHTWGPPKQEISFKDFSNPLVRTTASPGWQKILRASGIARNDGWQYLWVDTCCINKESSAELSEAINSMFQWYRNAQVCYAYLADVHQTGRSFEESKWFTRGWTLQELLAPRKLEFLDGNWNSLGFKDALSKIISSVTGIQLDHLENFERASIAQKMSWMSKRHTTRGEDVAYCMLGLFDVNLSLLYGEGERRAFMRLQHELINSSSDETIFAWNNMTLWSSGLLAHTPKDFIDSGNIIAQYSLFRPPYTKTNRGVCIELVMEQTKSEIRIDGTAVRVVGSVLPLECAEMQDYSTSGPGRIYKKVYLIFRVGNSSNSHGIISAIRLHSRKHLCGDPQRRDGLLNVSVSNPKQLVKVYFPDIRSVRSSCNQDPMGFIRAMKRKPSEVSGSQSCALFMFRLGSATPTKLSLADRDAEDSNSLYIDSSNSENYNPLCVLKEGSSVVCLHNDKASNNDIYILLSWPKTERAISHPSERINAEVYWNGNNTFFGQEKEQFASSILRGEPVKDLEKFSLSDRGIMSTSGGSQQLVWIAFAYRGYLEATPVWEIFIDMTKRS